MEPLLRHAEEVDEAEDQQYGKGQRGDELPAELALRESRLKKIREAKEVDRVAGLALLLVCVAAVVWWMARAQRGDLPRLGFGAGDVAAWVDITAVYHLGPRSDRSRVATRPLCAGDDDRSCRWDRLRAFRDSIERRSRIPGHHREMVYCRIVYYDSAEWTRRLVFLTDEEREIRSEGTDTVVKMNKGLGDFYPLRLEDYAEFTAKHSDFLLFAEPEGWIFQALRNEGAGTQILRASGDGRLYLVKMKEHAQPEN